MLPLRCVWGGTVGVRAAIFTFPYNVANRKNEIKMPLARIYFFPKVSENLKTFLAIYETPRGHSNLENVIAG